MPVPPPARRPADYRARHRPRPPVRQRGAGVPSGHGSSRELSALPPAAAPSTGSLRPPPPPPSSAAAAAGKGAQETASLPLPTTQAQRRPTVRTRATSGRRAARAPSVTGATRRRGRGYGVPEGSRVPPARARAPRALARAHLSLSPRLRARRPLRSAPLPAPAVRGANTPGRWGNGASARAGPPDEPPPRSRLQARKVRRTSRAPGLPGTPWPLFSFFSDPLLGIVASGVQGFPGRRMGGRRARVEPASQWRAVAGLGFARKPLSRTLEPCPCCIRTSSRFS